MPRFSLRTICMVLLLCRQIRVVSQLRGIKTPEIGYFPRGYAYLRHPFFARLANTSKSMHVEFVKVASVLSIFRARDIPEIGKYVVVPHAINVVYGFGGPYSEYVKPCEAMAKVSVAINHNPDIPLIVGHASLRTCKAISWAATFSPSKHPSLWVVVKQFAQTLCGKIGLSHDTGPSLIGQRPGRVISTSGLRYFITRTCSGVAEITQCLHQAARAAASVCMSANHCRLSNPFGALTPFNAL